MIDRCLFILMGANDRYELIARTNDVTIKREKMDNFQIPRLLTIETK